MTKSEFIQMAVKRGYCNKYQGYDFCSRHPASEYSENDLDQLYEFANRQDWAGTSDPYGRFRYCHVTAEDMNGKLLYRQNIYKNHDERILEERILSNEKEEETEGIPETVSEMR